MTPAEEIKYLRRRLDEVQYQLDMAEADAAWWQEKCKDLEDQLDFFNYERD